MLRFLSFLLGKPYEPCKGCEVLKHQIELVNAENAKLTDTLLTLVRPQIVQPAPVTTTPVHKVASSWQRQRAALEAEDKRRAQILEEQARIDRSLDVKTDELEKELLREEKADAS